ncbi:MAG TPA: hypothetical protein VHV77_17220 [Pirellulales bacterium]|nr:hypothetical protein [Pirellulales bacterium]
MSGRRKLLCVPCLLACLVAVAAAEDPWLGKQIMPKSESTMLSTSRQFSGSIFDISWPAVVSRVEGQWLWISDASGISPSPVSGWVRKDDVVLLDRADAFYASALQTASLPTLQWLRGICWESRGEQALALREYLAALSQRPELFDAELRSSRIRSYVPSKDRPWIAGFERASRRTGAGPRLYYEYAEAHRRQYQDWVDNQLPSSSVDGDQAADQGGGQQAEKLPAPTTPADETAAAQQAEKDFKRAKELYETAMRIAREWPAAQMGNGELLLAKAKWQEHQSKVNEDRIENLNAAIACFDAAILANPKNVDAYRERGDAYRRLHSFTLAKQSAHRACELTDYRQPRSLATLASIYADLSNFELAANYANKAGIYASDDIRHEIVEQRNHYVALAAPPETQVAQSESKSPRQIEREQAAKKAEMVFPRFVPRPLDAAP